MCPPRLSSQLALRVAKAAQQLNVSTKALMPVLIECVGLPFTKSRFSKTTVDRLAEALAWSSDPAAKYAAGETDAMRLAVQTLWGFGDATDDLPEPIEQPCPPVKGSILVAVASSDGKRLDEHFGGTLRYFIYRVTTISCHLVDVRSVHDAVDVEDITEFRVNLIQDCHLLYVRSIGGPPAGKVTQRGIHPLKVDDRPMIGEQLQRLQAKMGDAPPPWLAKAMGVPVEDRIRFTEATK